MHHTYTQDRPHTLRSVWVVIEGQAYRLGEGELPEQTSGYNWVLVEAQSECEALQQAEAYLRTRR